MTQLCTFTVGGHLLGIDVALVQEVARLPRPTPVPLAPAGIAGLVNLRGEVLTVIDLRVVLGLPGPAPGEPVGVVVRVDDEPHALLADGAGAVVDVVLAPLRAAPGTVDEHVRGLLLGAHDLPGAPVLALDPRRVVGAA